MRDFGSECECREPHFRRYPVSLRRIFPIFPHLGLVVDNNRHLAHIHSRQVNE